MRILFMGTPDFSVGILEAIVKAGHDVVGVVTQPDKPKGRGKAMQASPVKTAALIHRFPVYQPLKVREPDFVEKLKVLKPDVIVVVAFGQIIPKSILEIPPMGCINVHASLLPKYRGAAPVQWAVMDGERESGVTIMYMDTGIDTGDMLARMVIKLEAEETGGTLLEKLSLAGAGLLVETLPKLSRGKIIPEKQPADSPNAYARMIRKSDGAIRWNQEATVIERLIRGMNPWPSAYARLNGRTLKIWKAAVLDEESGQVPGTVVCTDQSAIYVQTGKGILRLDEIQLEGKKRMTSDAFLRGFLMPEGIKL